ncbi:MAG TPA: DUF4126 domain-containing protein [Vicinamibacteria bacterium]
MDSPFFTEVVPALAMAIGLAACAGLRAWLPLFLAGALARLGVIDIGESFRFVASDRALILFGVATLIEIAGDKIPAIDHALDALSTVLRPAAGSLLAAAVIGHVTDPLTASVLGIAVGAPSSLVPHAAKTSVRAISTALTGGIANPFVSLLEDMAALVLFAFTVAVPLLVVLALLMVGVVIARRLLRRRPGAALRTT